MKSCEFAWNRSATTAHVPSVWKLTTTCNGQLCRMVRHHSCLNPIFDGAHFANLISSVIIEARLCSSGQKSMQLNIEDV